MQVVGLRQPYHVQSVVELRHLDILIVSLHSPCLLTFLNTKYDWRRKLAKSGNANLLEGKHLYRKK